MRRSRGNVGLISPLGEKDRAGVAASAEKIDGGFGIGDFIDPGLMDAQSEEEHEEREGGESEPGALWRGTSHELRVKGPSCAMRLRGRREGKADGLRYTRGKGGDLRGVRLCVRRGD